MPSVWFHAFLWPPPALKVSFVQPSRAGMPIETLLVAADDQSTEWRR